jgi:hypothetical protein
MEGDELEELGIDGRTILKWIFSCMDWIELSQDRDR